MVDYLADHEHDALGSARDAFRCFEPYAEDPQAYAWPTRMVPTSCEDEVVRLLVDVRECAGSLDDHPEAGLDARQNAEVMAGAERYYRTMVRADGESWNIRDGHMAVSGGEPHAEDGGSRQGDSRHLTRAGGGAGGDPGIRRSRRCPGDGRRVRYHRRMGHEPRALRAARATAGGPGGQRRDWRWVPTSPPIKVMATPAMATAAPAAIPSLRFQAVEASAVTA